MELWGENRPSSIKRAKRVGLRNKFRSLMPQPPSFLLVFCPQNPSGEHRSRHLQVRRWRQQAVIFGEEKD